MSTPIENLAERIFHSLSDRLHDLTTLAPAEQDLLRRCCLDVADLQVRAMAAPLTAEARLALLREKAHVHAQLASLTAAGQARVAHAFWDAVRSAVNAGVSIAFAGL